MPLQIWCDEGTCQAGVVLVSYKSWNNRQGETTIKWCACNGNSLRWCHNGRYSVSNHQPHHCLLNRLFRRRSKKTPKLPVIGLCVGNSPGTGEFPAQMARNAESFYWWRHHVSWVNGTITNAQKSWDIVALTYLRNYKIFSFSIISQH